jgi:hypothetical protein
MEQLVIRKGDRFRAQIKPRVIEFDAVPVEVADLQFEDGTVTRQVPYASFSFLD